MPFKKNVIFLMFLENKIHDLATLKNNFPPCRLTTMTRHCKEHFVLFKHVRKILNISTNSIRSFMSFETP